MTQSLAELKLLPRFEGQGVEELHSLLEGRYQVYCSFFAVPLYNWNKSKCVSAGNSLFSVGLDWFPGLSATTY